jgi:hypothetical protein
MPCCLHGYFIPGSNNAPSSFKLCNLACIAIIQ